MAIIIGVLSLLLLGISLLVFVLFIELTVARARHSVQLLQEIGYSPSALKAFLAGRFMPAVVGAITFALLFAVLTQAATHFLGKASGLHFAIIPGWPLWSCALAVSLLLLLQMRTAIGRALQRA